MLDSDNHIIQVRIVPRSVSNAHDSKLTGFEILQKMTSILAHPENKMGGAVEPNPWGGAGQPQPQQHYYNQQNFANSQAQVRLFFRVLKMIVPVFSVFSGFFALFTH